MKMNLLKSLMVIMLMAFGITNAMAEVVSFTPSATKIQGDCDGSKDGYPAATNSGTNYYVADATEWTITQSGISSGAFKNINAPYGGSYILLAKFDCSAKLTGMNILKATLKYTSKCTVSKKNSNVQLAKIGTNWEPSTATWGSTNTSEIMQAEEITAANTNVGTTAKDITVDVTELLNNDEDKVVAFALYTYTAREQKISNYSLEVEYVDPSASANITVKYVDADGNEIKESTTRPEATGASVTVKDEEKAPIYNADRSKKYVYASDDSEGKTVLADGSTVVTIKFREAETWSYSLNAVDSEGNTLKAGIVSGTNFEGETFDLGYPYAINVNDTLYTTGKDYSKDKKGYIMSFTLDSNEKSKDLTYSATDKGNLVYLSEAENIEGLTLCNNGNTTVRSSNAGSAYAAEGPVTFTTLDRGIYKLSAVICDAASKTANSTWYFTAGGDTIMNYAATAINWAEGTSGDFTVKNAGTPIALCQGGNAKQGVDFIYIQKTGILPEPETAHIVFADSAYAMSGSSSTDGDITEPKVITTGSLTTTIYPFTSGNSVNRIWNSGGKPQLRIYGSKVTFEVPEGKSLRSLAFTFDSGKNGSSSSAKSTFNGVENTDPALWEGNSTNVVYEVAAQARIKTITAIIEDADAETTTYAPAPESLPVVENIAALKAMENNIAVELKVENAKVTFKNGNNIYIEDTTGALLLYNLGVEMTEGKEITGSLKGKFTMYGKIAELTANDSTANSSIVETLGEQFLGTEMTVAEANNLDNISKMAVLKDLPIVEKDGKHYLVYGTDTIMIYDKFKVLSAEYVWPTEVSQITGIIDNYNGVNQLAPLAEYAIVAKANIMEAENIASLNNYESGTVVKLMLNNAQVIMNNNNQYQMVIGDNTGSVVIGWDSYAMFNNTGKFAEGNILNGYVVAKANKEKGNWKLAANEEIFKDSVTFTEGTVEPLAITVAEAQYFVGRYVEFNNVVAEPDQNDGFVGNIKQGEATLPFEDLWWQLDEAIKTANYDYFRGILLYNDENELTLNIYGAGDLKPVVITPIPVVEINKIGDLKDLNDGTPVKLTVENAIVSVCEIKMAGFSQAPFMVLEDNTGGVQLEVGDGFNTMYGLADIIGITNDSTQVSGTICAQYTNAFGLHELIYDESMEESTITITPGVAPTATTMTPAQIKAAGTSMDYRLIKIESPVMGYDANEYMCTLTKDGDFVYIMDDFGKLAMNEETYEPIIFENLESVYGIINSAFAESVGSNTFTPTIFVLNTTGINGVNSTVKSMGDIYNMNGVKVRNAGEDMRGLQKGMYIMNGKKIIMK